MINRKVMTLLFCSVLLFTCMPAEARIVNADIDHVWDFTYPEETDHIKLRLRKAILEEHPDIPRDRLPNLVYYLDKYGKKFNLDPFFGVSSMRVEGDARNEKSDIKHIVVKNGDTMIITENACGYFQMKVNTFEGVMGYETTCQRIIWDVEEATKAGMKHLSELVLTNGANGLGAYNSGPVSGKWNFGYILKVGYEYKYVRDNFKFIDIEKLKKKDYGGED